MGKTKEELQTALAELMPEIAEYYSNGGDPLEVRFPWGVIKPLNHWRRLLPFLTESQQNAAACISQLIQVNAFFRNSVEIGMTAGVMREWHTAFPIICIIELLCRSVAEKERFPHLDPDRASFKKDVNAMQSNGIIKADLRDTIQELRDWRNNAHLYLVVDAREPPSPPRTYDDARKAANTLLGVMRLRYC